MIESKTHKECHQAIEHKRPRPLYIKAHVQKTCKSNQSTLSDDHRNTIEGRTNTNEKGLVVLVESHHIEPIGNYIMRSTTESK